MTTDITIILEACATSEVVELAPNRQNIRKKTEWQQWAVPQGGV